MSIPTQDGCPVCDWGGKVAYTHDRSHKYYTHIIERDGEVFQGATCSERTVRKDGLLDKLWRLFEGV